MSHAIFPESSPESRSTASSQRDSIYFICTGNICRSAGAHMIAKDLFPPLGITVDSAGIYAETGWGVDSPTAAALRARGWNPDGHVAKQATGRWLATGTLLVTFGPEHSRWIRDERPDAAARLVPFGALERAAGLGSDFRSLTEVLDAVRSLPASDDDWVPDPWAMGSAVAARTVERLERTLLALRDSLSAHTPLA